MKLGKILLDLMPILLVFLLCSIYGILFDTDDNSSILSFAEQKYTTDSSFLQINSEDAYSKTLEYENKTNRVVVLSRSSIVYNCDDFEGVTEEEKKYIEEHLYTKVSFSKDVSSQSVERLEVFPGEKAFIVVDTKYSGKRAFSGSCTYSLSISTM